jgi:hypothetical protein
MKKLLMYLFMGVGLLYTYALALMFKNYKQDSSEDISSHKDV